MGELQTKCDSVLADILVGTRAREVGEFSGDGIKEKSRVIEFDPPDTPRDGDDPCFFIVLS